MRISGGSAALTVRLGALFALLGGQVGCAHSRAVLPAGVLPLPECSPQVWSLDFVTVRPGSLPAYLAFLDSNWARARRTAFRKGAIEDYRILTPADSGATWHVLLMTAYSDSTAYADRESVFQPILRSQGLTLIDGKGTRELTERIENRLIAQRPVPPRCPLR